MNRRVLALLLCVPLLLSGCAGPAAEAESPSSAPAASSEEAPGPSAGPEVLLPEVFTLPYDASSTLDPITCSDGAQRTVGALLYEGLFRLDERLEPQNVLCASAGYDAASLTWTLRLREGVLFSDGTALTASDAAAALQRAMTSRRYQARLSGVKSVRTGRGTVVVTLTRPNAAFCSLLDIPIVKSGTEGSLFPTGTGPYACAEEDGVPYLAPNLNWWGDDPLPARRIALADCAGSDEARYRFAARDVQLITADMIGAGSFNASGGVDVWDADTTVLQYLGFNPAREPFQAPEARKRLGLGIDREAVAGLYLSGHALAAQFPISPVSPLYPRSLETAYSPGAFSAAMAAGGSDPGQKVPLTLLVNGDDPFKVTTANHLAAALSGFDWQLTVDPLPWDEYQSALAAGDFDLYYGEVRLTADWDLSALLGTGGSANPAAYSDPELDALLADCAASTEREDAVRALCEYLAETAPILPLCFKRISVLTQPGVAEGLSPTAADPFHGLGGIRFHLAYSGDCF